LLDFEKSKSPGSFDLENCLKAFHWVFESSFIKELHFFFKGRFLCEVTVREKLSLTLRLQLVFSSFFDGKHHLETLLRYFVSNFCNNTFHFIIRLSACIGFSTLLFLLSFGIPSLRIPIILILRVSSFGFVIKAILTIMTKFLFAVYQFIDRRCSQMSFCQSWFMVQNGQAFRKKLFSRHVFKSQIKIMDPFTP